MLQPIWCHFRQWTREDWGRYPFRLTGFDEKALVHANKLGSSLWSFSSPLIWSNCFLEKTKIVSLIMAHGNHGHHGGMSMTTGMPSNTTHSPTMGHHGSHDGNAAGHGMMVSWVLNVLLLYSNLLQNEISRREMAITYSNCVLRFSRMNRTFYNLLNFREGKYKPIDIITLRSRDSAIDRDSS